MADLLLVSHLKTLAGMREAFAGQTLGDQLAAVLTAAGHDPAAVRVYAGPDDETGALEAIDGIRDICALNANGPAVDLARWLGGILDAHGRTVAGEVELLDAASPAVTAAVPAADGRPAAADSGRVTELEAALARSEAERTRLATELDQTQTALAAAVQDRAAAAERADLAEQTAAALHTETDALTDALTDASARIAELEALAAGTVRGQAAEAVAAQMDELVAALTALRG